MRIFLAAATMHEGREDVGPSTSGANSARRRIACKMSAPGRSRKI